ncbi:MAG: hypothetical protein AVDCRST_MAG27-4353 [uncultured Craurococcus sp.]|uniref:Uncharacterized protein n=1 Tax=uncultured Craurococcus sp. TaxID=1135998 RepID=A0A6J4JTJ0_9PROT|nr:MAG: hypothetical protein AVDCRST_MAG27-4353 [uncultured Craurococcus sp.]
MADAERGPLCRAAHGCRRGCRGLARLPVAPACGSVERLASTG